MENGSEKEKCLESHAPGATVAIPEEALRLYGMPQQCKRAESQSQTSWPACRATTSSVMVSMPQRKSSLQRSEPADPGLMINPHRPLCSEAAVAVYDVARVRCSPPRRCVRIMPMCGIRGAGHTAALRHAPRGSRASRGAALSVASRATPFWRRAIKTAAAYLELRVPDACLRVLAGDHRGANSTRLKIRYAPRTARPGMRLRTPRAIAPSRRTASGTPWMMLIA